MKLAVGLIVLAAPFVVIFLLLRRAKRNRGSQHGGGIDGYRRIRR